jgi:excisionase family DNA binding protein
MPVGSIRIKSFFGSVWRGVHEMYQDKTGIHHADPTPLNVPALSAEEVYRSVFKEYPDVLNVGQVSELLGVCTKSIYRLLKSGDIGSFRIGTTYRIPKLHPYVVRGGQT